MRLILFLSLLMSPTLTLAHGMSEADKQRILDAGALEYIDLGARHMLTGYDHLLFLLGVLFFLYNVRDIVKFITAFTLGHSITLVFATLLTIKANAYLIDAVIALTVCYKAFENLDGFKRFFQIKAPSLLWMVFGFGLIHGFGLSTRLQQLPLPDDGLVLNILAFNVGVELGQILALCVMLLVLAAWRKRESFGNFAKACNGLLMILGTLLFLHQLHGYQHSVYSDDFPLNQDDHAHTHEDMESAKKIQGYGQPLMPSMPQEPAPVNAAPVEPPVKAEHTHGKSHRHGDGEPHHH